MRTTAMSRSSSSIAIFLSLITVLSTTTSADTPDCPYPCIPPPTSAGGSSINSYPPPPPSTGGSGGGGDLGGSYPPPPPGSYQLTPPAGYLPPPYSGYPSGPAPPPPNPVLPWFPWYYQHDNPVTGSTSPAVSGRSGITAAGLLPLSLLLLVLPRVW